MVGIDRDTRELLTGPHKVNGCIFGWIEDGGLVGTASLDHGIVHIAKDDHDYLLIRGRVGYELISSGGVTEVEWVGKRIFVLNENLDEAFIPIQEGNYNVLHRISISQDIGLRELRGELILDVGGVSQYTVSVADATSDSFADSFPGLKIYRENGVFITNIQLPLPEVVVEG